MRVSPARTSARTSWRTRSSRPISGQCGGGRLGGVGPAGRAWWAAERRATDPSAEDTRKSASPPFEPRSGGPDGSPDGTSALASTRRERRARGRTAGSGTASPGSGRRHARGARRSGGSAARRSAGAAGAGRRPSPSSTRRTSAGRGSPSGRSGRATASSPGGPARRGGRPARRAPSIAPKNGSDGSVERPPAVRITWARPPAPRAPADAAVDGIVLVGHVVDPDDRRAEALDLVPDARLEPCPVRRPERLLDDDRDPHRAERRDPDERPARRRRTTASPASTTDAATTCGATLTLATRSPAATIEPSSRVKTSSGSIRFTRSSSAARTWRTPSCSARRSTRLWTGPRPDEPGPGDGVGEPQRGIVLVQIALVEDDDRDRPDPERRIRGHGVEIGRGQPPALRPAAAADDEVARQDGPGEPGAAGDDPASDARVAPADEPSTGAGRRRPGQPSRPSAAAIARFV